MTKRKIKKVSRVSVEMKTQKGISWSTSLKSGDILLFKGQGFVSGLIRLVTRSEFTHVGVMVPHPDGVSGLMLLESTTLSDLSCAVVKGNQNKGVMLVDVNERVSTYKGDVHARIATEIFDEALLVSACACFYGKPYEQNYFKLLKSAVDVGYLFRNTGDLSSLFCSELVAEVLKRSGRGKSLAYPALPSDEYTPSDFADMPMRGYMCNTVTIKTR